MHTKRDDGFSKNSNLNVTRCESERDGAILYKEVSSCSESPSLPLCDSRGVRAGAALCIFGRTEQVDFRARADDLLCLLFFFGAVFVLSSSGKGVFFVSVEVKVCRFRETLGCLSKYFQQRVESRCTDFLGFLQRRHEKRKHF